METVAIIVAIVIIGVLVAAVALVIERRRPSDDAMQQLAGDVPHIPFDRSSEDGFASSASDERERQPVGRISGWRIFSGWL